LEVLGQKVFISSVNKCETN